MVKSKNNNSKPKNKSQRKPRNQMVLKRSNRVRTVTASGGLDPFGARWARLLADPCGAPLVPACYPNGGTGMLIRARTYVTLLSGANTNFQLSFVPGLNYYTYGQTVTGAAGTTSPSTTAFTVLNQYDAYRCVAACARIVYLGSEGNRAGQIGSAVTGSPIIEPSSVGVGSGPLLPIMQKVARLGEVVHETKWIPSTADTNFNTVALSAQLHHHGTITACGVSCPAESIQVELTGVFEIIPEYGSGLVAGSITPPSRNTVTDVLRALGDASGWAFSNVVGPIIKASAGMAMQSNIGTSQLVGGAARLMLGQ